ncbi:MAG: hypothetical protein KGL44_03870 [Sphingomonadales bacterium]|nr:hypothetical protein [Sphingomonadales bacterium]
MTPHRFLAALPLAAVLLGAAAPVAAKPLWRAVNPIQKQRIVTLRGDLAEVRLEPTTRSIGEGEDKDEIAALHIAVTLPGQPVLELPPDEMRMDVHGLHVGIGKLSPRDAVPVVILEGYSGGMHCCATFQMVATVDGKARMLALPGIDGDLDDAFPKDIDGDGTADIVRADDSFLYAFASYAASWAVPAVYNLRGGALVDVSAEPRFARLYGTFAAQTRRYCAKSDEAGNSGACASYAAAMARQGKAEEGIAFAVAHVRQADWLPEPCTVALVDDACPEGKSRSFSGFEQALRWFLKEHGYIA